MTPTDGLTESELQEYTDWITWSPKVPPIISWMATHAKRHSNAEFAVIRDTRVTAAFEAWLASSYHGGGTVRDWLNSHNDTTQGAPDDEKLVGRAPF